jgi:hypothetical protein
MGGMSEVEVRRRGFLGGWAAAMGGLAAAGKAARAATPPTRTAAMGDACRVSSKSWVSLNSILQRSTMAAPFR